MRKKFERKLYRFITALIMVVVIYALNQTGVIDKIAKSEYNEESIETSAMVNVTSGYTVTRIVDGDTLVVTKNGENIKVRLIGVDTPESVHPDKDKNTEFGKIATKFTSEKLLNKNVELELDVQTTDKYGRTLAYVYIDGEMYNKILLESGMAKVSTYPPNVKYVEEFKELQSTARTNKVGLWSDEYAN